jgi:hypothetical protein
MYPHVNMNKTEFSFINVPPEALPILGEPTPGTRFYRREGSDEECGDWFQAIGRIFKGDVGLSPGGVGMFVPVSRAAVHKRLHEGRLTGFAFYVTSQKKSLWGKPRKMKERPYLVLSVSECKAWAKDLKRKAGLAEETKVPRDQLREVLGPVASKDEPTTEREIEDADEFVEQDPKDKGRKGVVYGEPMSRDEIKFEIQLGIRLAIEEILATLLPGKLGEKHRKRIKSGSVKFNHKTNKWLWPDEIEPKRKKSEK